MVKNAPAGEARPHPEERARENCSSNSNARARVSKDEDEPLHTPSCFETHRSAANLRSMRAPLRCDAPQHAGDGALRILAKRSQAAAWARRTNLRVWGNERRLAFLFPACSLQGAMQLKGGSSTAPTRASLFATSSASPDPPFLTAQPRARGRAPTLQGPQITSSVLSSVSP
jgi:hypothetical protein